MPKEQKPWEEEIINEIAEIVAKEKAQSFKDGYNQRLRDEGKIGERWQHLYL